MSGGGVEQKGGSLPGCLPPFLRRIMSGSGLPSDVQEQLDWLNKQPDLQDTSGSFQAQALRSRGPTQGEQTKRRLRILTGWHQKPPGGRSA